MPKNKQQKQVTIDALTGGLKSAKGVVFANFQGLKVKESEELRNLCRAEKVIMLAAKKTLVSRALSAVGLSADPKKFSGGEAIFVAENDEIAPAKIVCQFARTHELATVFGGVLENKFIDAGMVKSLASLPGKKELLSKMVGSLNAPVSGFVNVLAGNLRNLVGVLNNIAKAKA